MTSVFDFKSLDFVLQELKLNRIKIGSGELTNLPLIYQIGLSHQKIIFSTGMSTLEEIRLALMSFYLGFKDEIPSLKLFENNSYIEEFNHWLFKQGPHLITLLHCVSEYPTDIENINLRSIHVLAKEFGLPVGLSDHTTSLEVPATATAFNVCLIEKHLTLSRKNGFVDSKFSLEPNEFINLTSEVKNAWASLGKVHFGSLKSENQSKNHRRSLYFVKDLKINETITRDSVKSIRPGFGLPTKYLDIIVGKKINREIKYGEPVTWDCFG